MKEVWQWASRFPNNLMTERETGCRPFTAVSGMIKIIEIEEIEEWTGSRRGGRLFFHNLWCRMAFVYIQGKTRWNYILSFLEWDLCLGCDHESWIDHRGQMPCWPHLLVRNATWHWEIDRELYRRNTIRVDFWMMIPRNFIFMEPPFSTLFRSLHVLNTIMKQYPVYLFFHTIFSTFQP